MTGPDPLERVRLTAAARESADREYRSALVSARAAGASFAAIAAAAGSSRQAIRQLLERESARGTGSN